MTNTIPNVLLDATGAEVGRFRQLRVIGATARVEGQVAILEILGGDGQPVDLSGYVTTTDPRLADARTPTAHGHALADLPAELTTAAELDAAIAAHLAAAPHEAGGEAAPHDHDAAYVAAADPRLTDARAPLPHQHNPETDFPEPLATQADLEAHETNHVTAAALSELDGRVDTLEAAAPAAGGIPAGIIAMWSGTRATIPSGWALCDGANGTPDLRDRFVVGAAAGADPGATGGAANHQHDAHADVVDHDHAITVTDPGHAHVEQHNNATTGPLRGWGAPDTSTNTPTVTGYSTSPATTGISADAEAPAGAVASLPHSAADHRPPFYALAFIQKLP